MEAKVDATLLTASIHWAALLQADALKLEEIDCDMKHSSKRSGRSLYDSGK